MSWTAQTSQKHRLPHLPNAISPLTSMRSTKTISRPGMAKVIADIAHMGGDYRRNEMLYYAIYYHLLDSAIGVTSSLSGIVNSIRPFCILLCIYTFDYVL